MRREKAEKEQHKIIEERILVENESLRVYLLEKLFSLKKEGVITSKEFSSAKEVLFFKTTHETIQDKLIFKPSFSSKTPKKISLNDYEYFIRDVESAYRLYQRDIIDISLYQRIIRHRISNYKAIHNLYKHKYDNKEFKFLLNDSSKCLISRIEILAYYYIHGAINKSMYNSYINGLFSIFFTSPPQHFYAVYSEFKEKIEKGYKAKKSFFNPFFVKIIMTNKNREEVIKIYRWYNSNIKKELKDWIFPLGGFILVLIYFIWLFLSFFGIT